jgi:hypothetical protein
LGYSLFGNKDGFKKTKKQTSQHKMRCNLQV